MLEMKCLLIITLVVFVTVVISDTGKPLFLPQLPVLEFDFAVKDSIGGWKENAYFYKTPKACSALKMFFGRAWTPIMDGLGIYNATCPIPVGFYKGPGINTAVFELTNFPKTFFYGTYRFSAHFTKQKIVYGCFMAIVEVKRPWETD
ncbi:uncharacterized protein LOC107882394 isoform X2 [Acyrthosiphon pisum]|uniref:Uncharacterized protein n=1 Tax=Acyrthosiphon pisum TaxID=7029 RepID=A0A8R2NS50_ACYPI|nr:uncharacterized protein LOC107882394 isoform X2 [Acyrthosiphon pisum]